MKIAAKEDEEGFYLTSSTFFPEDIILKYRDEKGLSWNILSLEKSGVFRYSNLPEDVGLVLNSDGRIKVI